MPSSGSIDIPHVTVHDHYIRKPQSKTVSAKEKNAIKEFMGLFAINEKNPTSIIKAKAYLNQYEKFEPKPYYLDSAAFYLNVTSTPFGSAQGTKSVTNLNALKINLEALVQLHFIKKNYNQIIAYSNQLTDDYLLTKKLTKQSYSNDHAWTCYRIAEAFYNTNNTQRALVYFKKALALAPYGLEFKNKYASCLATSGNLKEAEVQYTELLKEYPKQVSALTNLGFIKLQNGNLLACETLYNKALSLDPDYEPLLLNLAGLYAFKKDFKQSKNYLNRLLKKNPNNKQAQQALKQISQML